MNKRQVNPWTWQDQFGFSQAWTVDAAQSIVFVSGQAAMSADGEPVGEGDFDAQTRQTLAAIEVGSLALPGMMIEVEAIAAI